MFSREVSEHVSNHAIDHRGFKLPAWTKVITHRLLSMRPLEYASHNRADRFPSFVAETLRLAMILYLAPIWRFYGVHPTYTQVMVHKLWETLEVRLGGILWKKLPRTLYLWILFQGAFEAGMMELWNVKQYFVDAFIRMPAGEIDLEATIQNMLWVPELFDEQALALCRDIQGRRERIMTWIGHVYSSPVFK